MKLFKQSNKYTAFWQFASVLTCLAVAFCIAPVHDVAAQDPADDAIVIDISDAALRTVLETALGKAAGGRITAAEMKTLTRLNARQGGIVATPGGFANPGLKVQELPISPDWKRRST